MVALLSGLLAFAGRALADPLLPDAAGDELLSLDEALAELAELADAEELARSPVDVGAQLADDALVTTSGLVDPDTLAEAHVRRAEERASRWGRLDLAIAWRRSERDLDGSRAAMADPIRRDELWLVATWRH